MKTPRTFNIEIDILEAIQEISEKTGLSLSGVVERELRESKEIKKILRRKNKGGKK